MNLKLASEISKHKVVSFDIFDTLLTRKCSSPTHIFNFMRDEVRVLTNNKIHNFRSVRIRSQKIAEETALKNGSQDVTLDDIYNVMAKEFNISPQECEDIKCLEIEREIDSVVIRPAGYNIYKKSFESASYIILVSDMYLPRSVIYKLLDKVNVKFFEKLYLSSEIGLTKKTGDLFTYVAKDLKIPTSEIIHFGDNFVGDFKSALTKGVTAKHLPRSADNFKKAFKEKDNLSKPFDEENSRTSSYLLSIIQDRCYDDFTKVKKGFNGNLTTFACTTLGPLGVGFAAWLHSEAKRDGVNKLYFLSRDGLILKKAYDALYPNSNIETFYIKASRKIVKLSSIKSKLDIEERVKAPIYSTKLRCWLENNFGLNDSQLSDIHFESFGYKAFGDQDIGNKTDRNQLLSLCNSISDVIISNSQAIAKKYNEYLKFVGFDDKSGVVDIGYAGSMEKYFRTQTGLDIKGYYLSTFDSYLKEFDYLQARSYLTLCAANNDVKYSICTHRFIFEALLCSEENSFVCFEPEQEDFIERTNYNAEDQPRKEIVKKVHQELVNFWVQFSDRYNVNSNNIALSPKLSTFLFDKFLKDPFKIDAEILSGVIFEDAYGPSVTRYIMPPKGVNVTATQIIWKEGLNAITNNKSNAESSDIQDTKLKASTHAKESDKYVSTDHVISKGSKISTVSFYQLRYKLENKIVNITSSKKQYAKYLKDREAFFLDSKHKLIRQYYIKYS